ncbi:phage major tail tube protein, partial [Escherichia coli]|uniref:phage major tail tube protein n=1 Tax=Escherichia coli TaxID=562 RepID=UPI00208DC679
MAMPRKLKLMNVFLNGYSYQGVAKSVTLPKLTRKLENYRGAGMNAYFHERRSLNNFHRDRVITFEQIAE